MAKRLFLFKQAFRVMRQARQYDAVVLCTVGIEAFIVGKYRNWICPKTAVICADFLMPRASFLVRQTREWLTGVDAFVCIRGADIAILNRRFGVHPSKCHFVHFPASQAVLGLEVTEGDYIYSAGWAHRDWPTLIKALSLLPYKAIISAGVPVDVPEHAKGRITVLPMQDPASGRKLMVNATLVVLSLEDTELPSGPLVLLDAMAAGKAVVATDVNGTRDYVEDGRTGLLIAPGNALAMALAVDRLMKDDETRFSIGLSARETVCERFTVSNFLSNIIRISAQASYSP